MTQHTPGPWRHVGATFPERPRIYPPKNHVDMNYIAALNSRLDEYEANARLIAEAPAMFEQLRKALMELSHYQRKAGKPPLTGEWREAIAIFDRIYERDDTNPFAETGI